MSLIYVFAASRMEGQPVGRIVSANLETSATPPPEPPRSGANEIVLVIGGMGPKKAQAKATETLAITSRPSSSRRKPDAVLIIGLCGGLTRSLSENKIVAYTDCLSTEPDKPLLQCSAIVTNKVIEFLQSRGISCERVVGITSPRIAVTKDDKVALAKRGANAVDMESYEIIAVAGQAGIPAVALRVVSDTPDTNMPDFNRALNRDGMLDGRKALRVALASPIRTARLLSANKRAMSHLAKALEIILPADCFPKGQL